MRKSVAIRKNVRRGGFTLTEVLLVLAILGVIAAMVVPNLIGTQKTANIKATKINIRKASKTRPRTMPLPTAANFRRGAAKT